MDVYLASPSNQLHADKCKNLPVLISYSQYAPCLDRYIATYGKVLIDSGAFSVHTQKATVDIGEYREWSERFKPIAEAVAGLDDISGNWQQGLKNYEAVPWSFPTWHDSDPIELIPDLVALAQERKTWIAIGLKPPRQGKENIVRSFLERVPENIHIHGWALRAYMHIPGINSVDSTGWVREPLTLMSKYPFLTYAECLEIIIKRYQRQRKAEIILKKEKELWE